MPKIVLIEKSGTVKTLNVKDFAENALYKKAGLKSGEGFVLQHTWGTEDGLDQSIKLYGKKAGRAGQENKYDFPPPVDEILFFGPCILVGSDPKTNNTIDLDEDDWEEIYEFLFGGFDDIGSNDSEDEVDVDTEDELEEIKKTTGVVIQQTKQGYAKDGFIVDDEEDEETEEAEAESSDESYDTPPKKIAAKGRKPAAAKTKPVQNVVELEPPLQMEDCESELSEESYD
jgi:hypothetical protein